MLSPQVTVADGYRIEGRVISRQHPLLVVSVYDITAAEHQARQGVPEAVQRNISCRLAIELNETEMADLTMWLAVLSRKLLEARHQADREEQHPGQLALVRTHGGEPA
jgi:hypothetical protein